LLNKEKRNRVLGDTARRNDDYNVDGQRDIGNGTATKDDIILLASRSREIRSEIDKLVKGSSISSKRKRISEFIVDETLLKVGSEYVWLWVTIEPETIQILSLSISKERTMFVVARYLSVLVKSHGKHPVSTDGGGTWYPMAFVG
jgi:hypothetical protein